MAIKQRVAEQFRKFKELQGEPEYLARGVAIGVFIGFAPVMPFKSLSIITLTVLCSSSTIAALLICTLICNPLTYLPLYYLAWLVGDLLLPGKASWEVLQAAMLQLQQANLSDALRLLARIGFDTAVVMLVGGCIVAAPLALLSYPFAYRSFHRLRKKAQAQGG